jgi:hypothetical protein
VYKLSFRELNMVACTLPYDAIELFVRLKSPKLQYTLSGYTNQCQLGVSAHTDFVNTYCFSNVRTQGCKLKRVILEHGCPSD